jgi:pyruvate,water dikinase
MLDAAHCTRPRSRYMNDVFARSYSSGFRAGFERFGVMLETFEYCAVNGFPYTSIRVLGAPPDAKGPPPRFVLKALAWIHPALRRRIRRANEVIAERPWRRDLEEFRAQIATTVEPQLVGFAIDAIERASTGELIRHLDAIGAVARDALIEHFRLGAAAMLPVGDFVAHAIEWTGCQASDAIAALRGSSPDSVDAVHAVSAVRDALRSDPSAQALLDSDAPAAEKLARLRAIEGATGKAVAAWLDRVGHRLVTGFDISERTAIELPESLVATLRAAETRGDAKDRESVVQSFLARIPADRRTDAEALLEEARAVHRLRDARCIHDLWRLGLLRRAVIEAGRRLEESRRLERADHAVDLTHAEIVSLLRGGDGPSAAETATHAAWRAEASVRDAPAILGPPPAPPPSFDWLPPSAARVQRAVRTYVSAMTDESSRDGDARELRGLAASPGHYSGTARVVLEASDFERVQAGDVLVAWITTPTYNVVLPLLGGLVTERGGLLSHPAIVAREFGIPAVVGCRGATKAIPDGARVTVDGDRGHVMVAS